MYENFQQQASDTEKSWEKMDFPLNAAETSGYQ